jgi:hypothetical protein
VILPRGDVQPCVFHTTAAVLHNFKEYIFRFNIDRSIQAA